MAYNRLYKKKMTASTSTREFLIYSWSPPQRTVISKYLCGLVLLFASDVELIGRFVCCDP
jgi:hypothetical protein